VVRPVGHSLTSASEPVKGPTGPSPRPAAEARIALLEPIKKVRVAEEVARRIQALILDGTFKPGAPLPAERMLSQRFGVSRGSVRDALRKLEMIGLLHSKHGQGTFPQELSVANLVTPLASVLTYSRELQDELMDVRRMFEPAVARVAATRVTNAEIAELEGIVAAQQAKLASGEPALSEDAAFHAALARATHNRIIVRIMETLNDLLTESREAAMQQRGRPLRSVQAHTSVVEALRRRDADGAARAMHDHIDQIADLMARTHGGVRRAAAGIEPV
jgi:GntR family transcriptional repressor for pyruvate dehydrogenase complex